MAERPRGGNPDGHLNFITMQGTAIRDAGEAQLRD